MRLVAAAELQAEGAEEVAQLGQPLGRRSFVDAVERRVLALLEEVRRADVGRQHAFLDQAVGIVALVGFDALDLAVVVEDHARLDGLEVDGAALLRAP